MYTRRYDSSVDMYTLDRSNIQDKLCTDANFKPLPKEMVERAKALSEEYKRQTNIQISDQVTISQDAREAAERYQAALNKGVDSATMGDGMVEGINVESEYNFKSTVFESGMHTTTKNGSVIGVYTAPLNAENTYTPYVQITQQSGLQVQLVLSENMKIHEHEDGSLSVFYGDSHKKIHFQQDGTSTTYIDEEDTFAGTSGDDILINLNGSSVDGKEGDDIIFNLADNVTIQGGEGNDTILIPGKVNNNTIDSGNGNDAVYAGKITDSNITVGEGNNTLSVYKAFKSTITAGDGNNKAVLRYAHENSNITFGNGNNNIYTGMLGTDVFMYDRMKSSSNMVVGHGNNKIAIGGIQYSNLTLGDGNNTLKLGSLDHANYLLGKNTHLESFPEEKTVEEKVEPVEDKKLVVTGYTYTLTPLRTW